jgi:hypothetical protein
VNRLVADHAQALAANGAAVDAFRAALDALRADQLLAASLVNTLQEVTAIVPMRRRTASRCSASCP